MEQVLGCLLAHALLQLHPLRHDHCGEWGGAGGGRGDRQALGVKAGEREGGARGGRSGCAHWRMPSCNYIRYVLIIVMGISVFTVWGALRGGPIAALPNSGRI